MSAPLRTGRERPERSHVENCVILGRPVQHQPLIRESPDARGAVYVHMVGYALIPREYISRGCWAAINQKARNDHALHRRLLSGETWRHRWAKSFRWRVWEPIRHALRATHTRESTDAER